jgi:hypothetical protein
LAGTVDVITSGLLPGKWYTPPCVTLNGQCRGARRPMTVTAGVLCVQKAAGISVLSQRRVAGITRERIQRCSPRQESTAPMRGTHPLLSSRLRGTRHAVWRPHKTRRPTWVRSSRLTSGLCIRRLTGLAAQVVGACMVWVTIPSLSPLQVKAATGLVTHAPAPPPPLLFMPPWSRVSSARWASQVARICR